MSQTKAQLVDAVDGSIVAADLASNSVTTDKVLDSAITSDKTSFPVANRNLIINGAMLIAQRGTSSTAGGYCSVDRFRSFQNGLDEAPTYSQGNVTSGGAYNSGFRKSFKITNGNQTSAGADDHIVLEYRVEDQDLATSGWNYTSATSFISMSFWVKSSVAQNFYFGLQSDNGSAYRYVMETGSLTADTWTKITKAIPGNSNIVLNNDNGLGMYINWHLFNGTNRTGTRPLNAWAAADNTARTPDDSSTWYTTNDATFEITGFQLELGSVATDFEHRTYHDTIKSCMRYFQKVHNTQLLFSKNTSSRFRMSSQFMVPMRGTPSYTRTSNLLTAQGVGTNVSSSDTTEAQGGNTAESDGISYSRQWDFGGFTNLQDRSHGGANGNVVFHLDAEL